MTSYIEPISAIETDQRRIMANERGKEEMGVSAKRAIFLGGRCSVQTFLMRVISFAVIFSAVAIGSEARAQTDGQGAVVELRDSLENLVEQDRTAQQSVDREFAKAGNEFERGASELADNLREYVVCRSEVFSSDIGTEEKSHLLLLCGVNHSRRIGETLTELKNASFEIGTAFELVAHEYGELALKSRQELAQKQQSLRTTSEDLRSLEEEGRPFGKLLATNPGSLDFETEIKMRDVFARTQATGKSIASMERRIVVQLAGIENYDRMISDIGVEAGSIRQIGRELGYMAGSAYIHATEVEEYLTMISMINDGEVPAKIVEKLLIDFEEITLKISAFEPELPDPDSVTVTSSEEAEPKFLDVDDDMRGYFLALIDRADVEVLP